MKRLHMHVSVTDLAESIGFYETLFGAAPSVVHDDYAKWMLEDPRVNFAISQRNAPAGVDHVGIQVETPEELAELSARLKAAGEVTLDQENASCCYAKSDKSWVEDPSGVRWESFYTFDEITTYGEDTAGSALVAAATQARNAEAPATASACCGV
jgi:catechol 2,3-dioxygenase-like lactoylglutathione lyase family enzyme